MKFDELKKQLDELGHTGSEVYTLVEDSYITVPYPHGSYYEGFLLVALDDGVYMLPYTAVHESEDGYEVLDPKGFAPVDKELLEQAIKGLRDRTSAIENFVKMHEVVYSAVYVHGGGVIGHVEIGKDLEALKAEIIKEMGDPANFDGSTSSVQIWNDKGGVEFCFEADVVNANDPGLRR